MTWIRPARMPFALAAGVLLASASVPASADELRTGEQGIIYGSDDRVEVFEHPEEGVRRLAQESIVTLMPLSGLDFRPDGTVARRTNVPLQNAQNLCSGERFADQPTSGYCSGTLVAPNLVITAGHCIGPGEDTCRNAAFVFGYHYEAAGRLRTLRTEDVYTCQRIVAHALSNSGGRRLDYAVVQLDRPATPTHTPARVRTAPQALTTGQQLVMIGSPSGLPVKIDDGGRVRTARGSTLDYFVATTDSFAGNSGSGVFDRATLEQVGILVSGDTDYVQSGSCYRANVCAESGCAGENSTYVAQAVQAACQRITDEALCNTSSRCGDGFCAFDETPTSCAADCSAPVCGDGRCQGGEWQTCPDDCDFSAPPTWTCPPEYYGTMDGCDCECGAPDPDCLVGDGSSPDCGFFGRCGENGTCEGGGFGGLCTATSNEKNHEVVARSITGMALLALVGVWWWSRRRGALEVARG